VVVGISFALRRYSPTTQISVPHSQHLPLLRTPLLPNRRPLTKLQNPKRMKVTIMKIMRAKKMKTWTMRTRITNWPKFNSRSAKIFKKTKDCAIL